MATAPGPQKFEFVSFEPREPRPDRRSRKIVRQQVMWDYFRKQGKQTSRRRPGTNRKSTKPPRHAPVGPSDANDRQLSSPEDVHASESPSSTTRTHTSQESDVISRVSSRDTITTTRNDFPIHIARSPGTGRVDPFDSLLVRGLPDHLMSWYSKLYDCDTGAPPMICDTYKEWAQNIWHLSMQDDGLFYTLLSRAERNRMIMTKSENQDRYLIFRGQALRSLRERILENPDHASDAFILLVTTHISFTIADGDLNDARTHLQGASELIARRASTISQFVLLHALTMDIKLAVATLTRPLFDFRDYGLKLKCSPRLVEEVLRLARSSLMLFPIDFRCQAAEGVIAGLSWHMLVYDTLFEKEVGASSVILNSVRVLGGLRVLSADVWEESVEKRREDRSRPRALLILCLEFFAWMQDTCYVLPWLSHCVFMRRLARNMLGKLQEVLDLESGGLEEDWRRSGAKPALLLWVLMIAFATTSMTEPEANETTEASLSILSVIKEVVVHQQISDQPHLDQALTVFPWKDRLCSAWSGLIGARLGLSTFEPNGQSWDYDNNTGMPRHCPIGLLPTGRITAALPGDR